MFYRYKNTGTARSPWTTRSPSIRLGTSINESKLARDGDFSRYMTI